MTIAVDFDGVIHAYSRGWADGSIYDPPLPGALDGLRALMDRDAVYIFTTRDISQVASWLLEHGFSVRLGHDGPFWNERGRLLVTNRKLAATAYLDDRAIRFTDWGQALADLTQPGTPAAPEAANPDTQLTAEEARDLASELGIDLYHAQDALAFVGECCDIADREQRPVTTADVREWLKGARCGRQLAHDAAVASSPLSEQITSAIHADLLAHRGRLDHGLLGIAPSLTRAVLAVIDRQMPRLRALDEPAQMGCRCHNGDELCSGCHRCPDICNGCDGPENHPVTLGALVETATRQMAAELGETPSEPDPLEALAYHAAGLSYRLERVEAERDVAYRERNRLVALVAAKLGEQPVVAPAPDVDEPGWQILYFTLRGSQYSWHFGPSDADLITAFEHVPTDDPRAQRLEALTADLIRRCGPACAEGHTYTSRCEDAHPNQPASSPLPADGACAQHPHAPVIGGMCGGCTRYPADMTIPADALTKEPGDVQQ